METLFRFINIYPMPIWLGMMFAPKHRFTEKASRSSVLFGFAALNYLIALLVSMRSGASKDQGLPDFTSFNGVSNSLGTREGALGAWSHMLALDLFTGAWIYRQCRRLNAPSWIRITALIFTLMTGPLGLFLFLFWRLIDAGEDEAFPNDYD